MPKKYQDRAMASPTQPSGRYFFPKAAGGPVVIEAKTQEEAEKKLQAIEQNT
jgi:hypothetical protein